MNFFYFPLFISLSLLCCFWSEDSKTRCQFTLKNEILETLLGYQTFTFTVKAYPLMRLCHRRSSYQMPLLILFLRSVYLEKNPVISCFYERQFGSDAEVLAWLSQIWNLNEGNGLRFPSLFVNFHQIFTKCSQSTRSALHPISEGMREASLMPTQSERGDLISL